MSDILEIIKTRRSVRKYKSDMVPTDIIDKIVGSIPVSMFVTRAF